MASAHGGGIDAGLSENDAMVGRSTSVGQAASTTFSSRNFDVELSLKEKLVAVERFPQISKYYPSQSEKTLFEFF